MGGQFMQLLTKHLQYLQQMPIIVVASRSCVCNKTNTSLQRLKRRMHHWKNRKLLISICTGTSPPLVQRWWIRLAGAPSEPELATPNPFLVVSDSDFVSGVDLQDMVCPWCFRGEEAIAAWAAGYKIVSSWMCLAGAAAVATVPPHSWWCSAFARALSGEEIQRGESKTYREEKEASTTSEIVRLKSVLFQFCIRQF